MLVVFGSLDEDSAACIICAAMDHLAHAIVSLSSTHAYHLFGAYMYRTERIKCAVVLLVTREVGRRRSNRIGMLYQKNRERVQEKRVGAQMLCCIYVAFCFAFTLHVSLLHSTYMCLVQGTELRQGSQSGWQSITVAGMFVSDLQDACMCTAVFQDKNEKHSSLQVTM